jgi:hypothetical protein
LYVGSAVVQARPDAGVDDLPESILETVELARLARETAARHVERDVVRAEEHLQHGEMSAVASKVP